MAKQTASPKTLDISHLIRNRLTSIALCADSLQQNLVAGLSAEQTREFSIIQSSIADIKSVLDQLAGRYYTEMRQQCPSEPIGSIRQLGVDDNSSSPTIPSSQIAD